MSRTRLVAISLQVVGGLLALAGIVLLVSWIRTHNEMNHAGIFLLLGAVLIGLIGLVILILGVVLRPVHSNESPR